jgi:hypothetical protein
MKVFGESTNPKEWTLVAVRNNPFQSNKSDKYIVTMSDPIIKIANRFLLLTNLEVDSEDPCGPQKWNDSIPAQTTQNAGKLLKEGTRIQMISSGRLSHIGRRNLTVAKKKKITSVSDPNLNSKEHKVKVIGDSHLKDTAIKIDQFLTTKFEVSSWIKPGAMENDLKYLGKSDVIIISGGANDVNQIDLKRSVL